MQLLVMKVHAQTQLTYMAVTIQVGYKVPEPFIRPY